MASSANESSPLLPQASGSSPPPPRSQRTVTFDPNPTTAAARPLPTASSAQRRPSPIAAPAFQSPALSAGGQPVLSALNSKLRRRNSHGSPLSAPPAVAHPALKIGPQRTTKNAQKLKLLPNPDPGDGVDEESGRDVYAQFTRLKDPTSRRDAARLGKADRETLPRVTAYCTANSYRMNSVMKFFKGRGATRGASPKQFDECIYSPFQYPRRKSSVISDGEGDEPLSAPPRGREAPTTDDPEPATRQPKRRKSDSALEVEENTQSRREELLDLTTAAGDTALEPVDDALPDAGALDLPPLDDGRPVRPHPRHPEIDTEVHTPEVFLFDYGTVVVWGMTRAEEARFLRDVAKFETEKLGADDVQSEDFNFYYTREYQARIYNDFISLRDKRNYMTKLAISHALSQSVKTSLFEDLLSTTIAATTPLPAALAADGALTLSRRAINRKIGELFILRINIHLQGSVLDSPELLWAEPRLQPVYAAVRDYLEMDERARLLTQRLDVLADLLAVLKDQARTSHGEALEWIVIVLIAAEILVAAVNIVVDLVAGVD